jgi:WD40 repeat protein
LDDTVRLWDVAMHRAIGTPFTGHTGVVNAVAFSPDGMALATASSDKTVRLWDVATHRAIGTPFTGHTDFVNAVAFSPDGRTLATASNDKTVRLWDVSVPSDLLTTACAIASRSLTRAEWEQYAPGEKFHPVCG